ncbi:MAG: cyanophycinase [Acidobacteriota bacterium]
MTPGTLIAIGGAENTGPNADVLGRFVRLCGGAPDAPHGRLIVVPTASQRPESGPEYADVFYRLGAAHVDVLAIDQRSQAEQADVLAAVDAADGVFFTGGDQLRLSSLLGGTALTERLRSRRDAGLHIAGTSAGAAFLSEHMIAYGRGGHTPKRGMMQLTPGLGVLRRAIVDQHFRQRDRIGRLIAALAHNPRPVGLGVDEDTAVAVGPDDVLEVWGRGAVTVVDGATMRHTSAAHAKRSDPLCVIGLQLHVLTAGAHYDLRHRRAYAPGEDLGAPR